MTPMKLNRTYLFIATSSVALLIVLIIQVNWIFETARMKEELFNETANIVLAKTAEALSSDKQACSNLEQACGDITPSKDAYEVRKVDSLFQHYMKAYNIHVDYYFEVKSTEKMFETKFGLANSSLNTKAASYQACVTGEPGSTGGLGLRLVIPDKRQFIIAEMGVPFFTSVLLIIVVLILSWRTILSLLKEKKISEHTTDFLNNMTHEFKTPLTNIALAGKMIVKDATIRQEDKIRHYSGIILEENEKLRLQVEQVLSMTAFERGEIPLQKTELDFHQLLHEALKCISIQVENKQGNVQLNLNAEHFIIMGDKTHLTNAVCNLIDNAVKYANEKPELIIQTKSHERNLILTVTDHGIGIEKEYHEKVFEKFFRVPTGDVHNVKGFGLGLSYTKKIIVLHGGTIALESEKGKGATFTITLPHV